MFSSSHLWFAIQQSIAPDLKLQKQYHVLHSYFFAILSC